MKKLMLFLAACVALTACKKEVLTKGTPFQKGETVTISAGTGGGGNAKVSGEDAISSINFTWDEGDEIKVTVGTASSNFQLSTGAGNTAATFTGTMPASGTNFDVQYPVTDPDLTTQDYVAGKVPKDKMLFTATNCTKDQMANLEMAYAILKLQFTGSGQEVSKIVVKTVDYSTPEKSYTLNTIGVILPNEERSFLMVVDPMEAKLEVTLFDNNDQAITSFTTSTAQPLEKGKCRSMPMREVTSGPTEEPQCLCFTALQDGSSVSFPVAGEDNFELKYYCPNKTDGFQSWDGEPIGLNYGEKVYIQAGSYDNYTMRYKKFSATGDLKVSGNIMYLLNTNPGTTMAGSNNECFGNLFQSCDITDASGLILPATTLIDNCYNSMFMDCASLTKAPALPATTLDIGCYGSMFKGCTSLQTAPALPASTLANGCYDFMFEGCTSLTTAPELSATTLEEDCYQGMFYGCSSLTSVTMLATSVSASNCLTDWLSGAALSGTVHVASGMENNQTILENKPDGWSVSVAE